MEPRRSLSETRPDECDATLIVDSAAGDLAAFDRLATRHLGRFYLLALRLVDHPADAEEIAQEAMLRVWRSAGRYDPAKGKAATWLNRIVLNLAIDRMRSAPPARTPLAEDLQDMAPDAAAILQARQQRTSLLSGLAALPARQRQALTLTYLEELAAKEAARALGVSTRGLEGLLRRGRRFLRDWMRAREV